MRSEPTACRSPSIDRPVPQAILDGRIWEKDTVDLIVRHVGKGDVVHAGTYFGDFLPALAASVASGAKVWAFDPNLESFRCSQITLLLRVITKSRSLTPASANRTRTPGR